MLAEEVVARAWLGKFSDLQDRFADVDVDVARGRVKPTCRLQQSAHGRVTESRSHVPKNRCHVRARVKSVGFVV